MSIKDHKPVALFKSVTYPIQKEKEKYFIVETVKHTNTPQKPFHSITTNSHQQNHNSNKSTSTNFTVKSDNNKSSKKDQGSNSKAQNIQKANKIDEITQKAINEVNLFIEKNKLTFSELWSNKPSMEDLNLPKTFQEQNMNIELNRIILNSIINVSKYINELFDKLINGNNDNQTYQSILICLSALQQKINYFLQIKIHSFKIEMNAINDIVILKHHLDYMNNCFQSELSQNLKDISNTLNELFIYVN